MCYNLDLFLLHTLILVLVNKAVQKECTGVGIAESV
jgi:hypothetical protein